MRLFHFDWLIAETVRPTVQNAPWIRSCEIMQFISDCRVSPFAQTSLQVVPNRIRGSLRSYWHIPFRTKTKDLFITLRFNYLKVFIVRVPSLLDRFNKDWKDAKNSTFKKDFEVVLPVWPTFLGVNNYISCVLSLNFENRWEWQKDMSPG